MRDDERKGAGHTTDHIRYTMYALPTVRMGVREYIHRYRDFSFVWSNVGRRRLGPENVITSELQKGQQQQP